MLLSLSKLAHNVSQCTRFIQLCDCNEIACNSITKPHTFCASVKTSACYYAHIYRQKHLVRTLMSGAASSLLFISSEDSIQSTAAAAADSSDHDINDISGQKKVYFALMRLHPIDLRLTYKALPTGDDVISSNSNSNGQSNNDNSGSNNNSAPAEVGALSTLAQVWLYIVCHVYSNFIHTVYLCQACSMQCTVANNLCELPTCGLCKFLQQRAV
jgi:hypothetical protein